MMDGHFDENTESVEASLISGNVNQKTSSARRRVHFEDESDTTLLTENLAIPPKGYTWEACEAEPSVFTTAQVQEVRMGEMLRRKKGDGERNLPEQVQLNRALTANECSEKKSQGCVDKIQELETEIKYLNRQIEIKDKRLKRQYEDGLTLHSEKARQLRLILDYQCEALRMETKILELEREKQEERTQHVLQRISLEKANASLLEVNATLLRSEQRAHEKKLLKQVSGSEKLTLLEFQRAQAYLAYQCLRQTYPGSSELVNLFEVLGKMNRTADETAISSEDLSTNSTNDVVPIQDATAASPTMQQLTEIMERDFSWPAKMKRTTSARLAPAIAIRYFDDANHSESIERMLNKLKVIYTERGNNSTPSVPHPFHAFLSG